MADPYNPGEEKADNYTGLPSDIYGNPHPFAPGGSHSDSFIDPIPEEDTSKVTYVSVEDLKNLGLIPKEPSCVHVTGIKDSSTGDLTRKGLNGRYTSLAEAINGYKAYQKEGIGESGDKHGAIYFGQYFDPAISPPSGQNGWLMRYAGGTFQSPTSPEYFYFLGQGWSSPLQQTASQYQVLGLEYMAADSGMVYPWPGIHADYDINRLQLTPCGMTDGELPDPPYPPNRAYEPEEVLNHTRGLEFDEDTTYDQNSALDAGVRRGCINWSNHSNIATSGNRKADSLPETNPVPGDDWPQLRKREQISSYTVADWEKDFVAAFGTKCLWKGSDPNNPQGVNEGGASASGINILGPYEWAAHSGLPEATRTFAPIREYMPYATFPLAGYPQCPPPSSVLDIGPSGYTTYLAQQESPRRFNNYYYSLSEKQEDKSGVNNTDTYSVHMCESTIYAMGNPDWNKQQGMVQVFIQREGYCPGNEKIQEYSPSFSANIPKETYYMDMPVPSGTVDSDDELVFFAPSGVNYSPEMDLYFDQVGQTITGEKTGDYFGSSVHLFVQPYLEQILDENADGTRKHRDPTKRYPETVDEFWSQGKPEMDGSPEDGHLKCCSLMWLAIGAPQFISSMTEWDEARLAGKDLDEFLNESLAENDSEFARFMMELKTTKDIMHPHDGNHPKLAEMLDAATGGGYAEVYLYNPVTDIWNRWGKRLTTLEFMNHDKTWGLMNAAGADAIPRVNPVTGLTFSPGGRFGLGVKLVPPWYGYRRLNDSGVHEGETGWHFRQFPHLIVNEPGHIEGLDTSTRQPNEILGFTAAGGYMNPSVGTPEANFSNGAPFWANDGIHNNTGGTTSALNAIDYDIYINPDIYPAGAWGFNFSIPNQPYGVTGVIPVPTNIETKKWNEGGSTKKYFRPGATYMFAADLAGDSPIQGFCYEGKWKVCGGNYAGTSGLHRHYGSSTVNSKGRHFANVFNSFWNIYKLWQSSSFGGSDGYARYFNEQFQPFSGNFMIGNDSCATPPGQNNPLDSKSRCRHSMVPLAGFVDGFLPKAGSPYKSSSTECENFDFWEFPHKAAGIDFYFDKEYSLFKINKTIMGDSE